MTQCILQNCPRPVKPGSRFKECTVCRGNMLGWRRKAKGRLKQYMEALALRTERMGMIDDIVKFVRKRRKT